MDKTLILSKIESLKRCTDRVRSKTPSEKEVLFRDLDIQDIIVLNLERAVQISVDISAHISAELDERTPMTMSEGFDILHHAGILSKDTARKMKKSVGFRNIAVHEYESVSWDVVYAIITHHLDDFRIYAQEVLQWLKSEDKKPG